MLFVAGLFGMFFLGALQMQRVLRLRRDRSRPGVPAGRAGDRGAVAGICGAADHALRRQADAGRRARRSRRSALMLFRDAPVHAQLRAGPAADDGAARRRRGLAFPSLMTIAMSSATAGGRRHRLRPGQHHPAGRWRARAGGARDAVEHPHQLAAGQRRLDRVGADQRLPPGVHDWSGADRGRDRARGLRAALDRQAGAQEVPEADRRGGGLPALGRSRLLEEAA